MTFWPSTSYSDYPTDQTFRQFHDLDMHSLREDFSHRTVSLDLMALTLKLKGIHILYLYSFWQVHSIIIKNFTSRRWLIYWCYFNIVFIILMIMNTNNRWLKEPFLPNHSICMIKIVNKWNAFLNHFSSIFLWCNINCLTNLHNSQNKLIKNLK